MSTPKPASLPIKASDFDDELKKTLARLKAEGAYGSVEIALAAGEPEYLTFTARRKVAKES
jgi:hypothetical protein